MSYRFPSIELKEPERIWINGVYSMIKNDEEVNLRKLKVQLRDKLPNNFNPKDIDVRLLRGNTELTLLGIWHVDETSKYIELCNNIIILIKEMLISNPEITKIITENIAKQLNISEREVSNAFKLINQAGNFWDSATGNGTIAYSEIHIGDEAFNEYIKFESIETLMKNFFEQNAPRESALAKLFKRGQKENTENTYEEKDRYDNRINPIFRTKITTIDRRLCFVLMPFTEEWSNRVYNELIKKNIESLGLQCLRADNLNGPIIIEDIWAKINQCAFIIADVSTKNPNVMYELGIVHTIGKPAILITQDLKNIPFDFTHLRHYEYKDNVDGFNAFVSKLPIIVKDIYKEYYNDEIDIF